MLSLLLQETGRIFQLSVEPDTDKHIADSNWAYVQESILKLQDVNQSSVWDHKVPLSCLFSSISDDFAWSNDIRIDADKLQDIFEEIYESTVDKESLKEVLTETIQDASAEVCKHTSDFLS